MSNTHYRGYTYESDYDPHDRIFFGRIAGISDSIGFHSDTREALVSAFRDAVDDYIETCRKIGKMPQDPMGTERQSTTVLN
jgi:predicted HicB family RNase H-like nuclease